MDILEHSEEGDMIKKIERGNYFFGGKSSKNRKTPLCMTGSSFALILEWFSPGSTFRP